MSSPDLASSAYRLAGLHSPRRPPLARVPMKAAASQLVSRRGWAALALFALAATPTVAQQKPVPGPLEVALVWTRPADAGARAIISMTLINKGEVRDDLLRVACADSDGAEIDAPAQGDTPAHRVDGVPVPPHATVQIGPGGYELVLLRLLHPIRAGETMACTATFVKSGERLIEVNVRNDPPPPISENGLGGPMLSSPLLSAPGAPGGNPGGTAGTTGGNNAAGGATVLPTTPGTTPAPQ